MSDPLRPGDIPKWTTRAERRRWDAADAADARQQMSARPNLEPTSQFDRCPQSKYQTHRFVANLWTTCEFCGKHYKDCLLVKPEGKEADDYC